MSTAETTPTGPSTAASGAGMRAVVQHRYGGADTLTPEQTARPHPGKGQVLLRVHAAGLDRGTWHLMAGRPYLMRLLGFGLRRPKNPVPGRDVAGTVDAAGEAVTAVAVGEEVFGVADGSFADFAVARADQLVPRPQALSVEAAAVLAVSGTTALRALRTARVGPGSHVLVVGASGGVGSYAVQIAKAWGAVVTAVASTAKQDLVRSLGADHVVDYTRQDVTAAGQHYDAILDIGGDTRLRRLRRVLAPQGTLVIVGGEGGGRWFGGIDRQLRAMALSPFVGQRLTTLVSIPRRADLEELAGMVADGTLVPALDRVLPLEQAAQAMRELEAGRVRGKIALRVSS